MHKILFRGKPKNELIDWVYGYYFYSELTCKHYIMGESKDYGYTCIEVIPETVGQYTGLKDKNGTKIFEGDIIKDKDNNVFIMEYGEFFADDVSNMFFDMFGYQGNFNLYGLYAVGINSKKENIMPSKHSCVIIGNIHDNPELLNTEDSL